MNLSEAEVAALVKEMAPVIRDYTLKTIEEYVANVIAPATKNLLDPLRLRVKELEDGGIKYRGVHQRADSYKRGEVVTADGCAWIALKDTAGERPGTGDAWQLMVKAGRDAR